MKLSALFTYIYGVLLTCLLFFSDILERERDLDFLFLLGYFCLSLCFLPKLMLGMITDSAISSVIKNAASSRILLVASSLSFFD